MGWEDLDTEIGEMFSEFSSSGLGSERAETGLARFRAGFAKRLGLGIGRRCGPPLPLPVGMPDVKRAVRDTGTIRDAAVRLGVSYGLMHWLLHRGRRRQRPQLRYRTRSTLRFLMERTGATPAKKRAGGRRDG